jgi:hypothetical protein
VIRWLGTRHSANRIARQVTAFRIVVAALPQLLLLLLESLAVNLLILTQVRMRWRRFTLGGPGWMR